MFCSALGSHTHTRKHTNKQEKTLEKIGPKKQGNSGFGGYGPFFSSSYL